jgi:hypothetical protein
MDIWKILVLLVGNGLLIAIGSRLRDVRRRHCHARNRLEQARMKYNKALRIERSRNPILSLEDTEDNPLPCFSHPTRGYSAHRGSN